MAKKEQDNPALMCHYRHDTPAKQSQEGRVHSARLACIRHSLPKAVSHNRHQRTLYWLSKNFIISQEGWYTHTGLATTAAESDFFWKQKRSNKTLWTFNLWLCSRLILTWNNAAIYSAVKKYLPLSWVFVTRTSSIKFLYYSKDNLN